LIEVKQSKTLKLDLGVYQHKQGVIAVTVDNKLLGQLSSDPKSKNYNEVLFKEFKARLVEAGKWQD